MKLSDESDNAPQLFLSVAHCHTHPDKSIVSGLHRLTDGERTMRTKLRPVCGILYN